MPLSMIFSFVFLLMIMFLALIGLCVVLYALFYIIGLCWCDCDLELSFLEKHGKSIGTLNGKVVFITGASSGIGEHIAKALARNGAKLVLTARRKNELERVAKECKELSKGLLSDKDILLLPFDITELSLHEKAFNDAVNHFGSVDILINNAGRSQRALFENIQIAVDQDMFDLNVFSVVHLSRIAVRYFNEKGAGHIAVVSSIAGIFGVPFSATYTATKHAIHGYFNGLRNEKLGRNIAVTLLCPGPTFSNFLQNCYTETEGEKYGIEMQKSDRRMTGQRCGELCAIALANKTTESWMGLFPLMHFSYIAVYFPNLTKLILNLGGTRIFNFRDGEEIKLKVDKA